MVRKIQTSHDLTYQFTMIETSAEVLKVYYADPRPPLRRSRSRALRPITWSGSSRSVMVPRPSASASRTHRSPNAATSPQGDEAIGYDVTLTAYPDSTGTKAYIYMA
ncbi:hypothetical protein [Arthrobacter woluwensis]|nr:hypothetical protein [Arthrobacter woluwensis]